MSRSVTCEAIRSTNARFQICKISADLYCINSSLGTLAMTVVRVWGNEKIPINTLNPV